MPSGLTFDDNGNATATIAGTPAVATGGTYTLSITAYNGVGSPDVEPYALTVNEAPSFTSANAATFTVGTAGSLTVTTIGFPFASLSKTGTLPAGVTFVDNGNGTATLAGTPAAGTGGIYHLTLQGTNGVGAAATQAFTLTVTQGPAITSPANQTFTVGSAGLFFVRTTGFPAGALSLSGTLPAGVTFRDRGNGTATLSGTPAVRTGGIYSLTLSATNGAGTAPQSFALTVEEAPTITSASHATFIRSQSSTFTVSTLGFPKRSSCESAALPAGVTFTDNHDGTATLAGTPANDDRGIPTASLSSQQSHRRRCVAGLHADRRQSPRITSANSHTFTAGQPGSFTFAPPASRRRPSTETGALPSGLTFVDNDDGTATLSGTPPRAPPPITPSRSRRQRVGTDASQSFTLTVNQPPAITSAGTATFTVGPDGSFTVSTTGFPIGTLTQSVRCRPG